MSMRRNRNGVSKERIIMLVSSALVLTALTVTGVVVRSSRQDSEESNVVDLSAIESGTLEGAENVTSDTDISALFADVGTDDLDYDPSFQEANSDRVENAENGQEKTSQEKTGQEETEQGKIGQEKTGTENGTKESEGKSDEAAGQSAQGTDEGQKDAKESDNKDTNGKTKEQSQKESDKKESNQKEDEGMIDETKETSAQEPEDTEAIATTVQPVLDFTDEDALVWPIVGNILLNYSMDKTIYFPTLQQYKYHPAIVISASEGETITAAADGRVTSVAYDRELGNIVVMDLGNQYELTYGQLDNITVSEGSYVATGDIIGNVAAPTKYYSTEGANVYFKLTKEGQPVNPLGKLKE
ncbi:MAG: peptidoglycan DD-metalloendopeptidase family protein [Muribaculaceae bacterium]|nr:peptidoglycan DD-metalloendopeptidase family protein [Muribaculaceae bacterium]